MKIELELSDAEIDALLEALIVSKMKAENTKLRIVEMQAEMDRAKYRINIHNGLIQKIKEVWK